MKNGTNHFDTSEIDTDDFLDTGILLAKLKEIRLAGQPVNTWPEGIELVNPDFKEDQQHLDSVVKTLQKRRQVLVGEEKIYATETICDSIMKCLKEQSQAIELDELRLRIMLESKGENYVEKVVLEQALEMLEDENTIKKSIQKTENGEVSMWEIAQKTGPSGSTLPIVSLATGRNELVNKIHNILDGRNR